MKKRILLILLTAALLLASCGNAASVTETGTDTADTAVETTAETTDPVKEAKDSYYASLGTVS